MGSVFSHNISRWGVFLALVSFVFVQACSPREPIPEGFPNEDEMADIVADLYWTESVISNGRIRFSSEEDEAQIPGYYHRVLEKHNLTAEQFDSIRQWYASHPYHYQDVYDEVIVILSQREADFNNRLKEQEASEDTVTVLKDLWTGERKLRVTPGDSSGMVLPFNIELDSLVMGQIRLSGFYKFLRPDMTRDAHVKMIALYADSAQDSVSYELVKAFKEKAFSLSLPVDTTDTIIQISGVLFEHDAVPRSAVEFSKIKLEHLEEKTDSIKPSLKRPGINKQ